MKPQFFSHLRFGLIALGMLAGVSAPATAAPLTPVLSRAAALPAASEGRPDVAPVRYRRCYGYGGCYGGSQLNYRYRNDDNWRYRRHHRPYRRYHRPYGPQLYFGLGVPAYRYYAPPRRYYRQRLGSSHVAWCYDRWRSYRAWDNTYQPYNGPRRQCWSPYSG